MFLSLFSSFEAEKWQEKLLGFSPAIKKNYEKENFDPKNKSSFSFASRERNEISHD
jgi:hypothetical protein